MKSFKAIKVKQNDWEFYVLVMPSDILYKVATVSRRYEDKKEGYQRTLSLKRAEEINDYVFKCNGMIPNNIILNFDVSLNFDSATQSVRFAIKDDIAWVVDGQHRMYGLSLNKKNIDVVVVAFERLNIPEQAKMFKTINSKQKAMNSSLIYDLIDLTKDGTYAETRAHDLIKKLNEENSSPWKDKIKMIGTGPGLVSQSAFVNCLKPHLHQIDGVLYDYTEEEQYKILENYFNALRLTYPDDWGNPKSLLTKTVGFYAWMDLMPKVIQCCLKKETNLSTKAIGGALEPLRHYNFDSNGDLKGVSGKQGVQRIAAELSALLTQQTKMAGRPSGLKL